MEGKYQQVEVGVCVRVQVLWRGEKITMDIALFALIIILPFDYGHIDKPSHILILA